MRLSFLKSLGPLLVLCFCLIQCKTHYGSKTELQKLPAITQSGANTFGCLLNGVAWIPNDNYGQATFNLNADPTFQNGVFGISAIKYYASGKFQVISFGSDSCKDAGNFLFSQSHSHAQYFDVGIPLTMFSGHPGITCTGSFNISKYDKINLIFSGTFEFTISDGSNTIRITNGRFDKKL